MIPQKDIRFIQQKAFKLLSEGKGIEEIRKLILDEGGDEAQVQSLSRKYLEDFEFLISESRKKAKKDSSMYKISGIVIFVCGLLITAISYISTDGGGSVLLWGVMALGAILFFRGISLNKN